MTYSVEDRYLSKYLAALKAKKTERQATVQTKNEALALDFMIAMTQELIKIKSKQNKLLLPSTTKLMISSVFTNLTNDYQTNMGQTIVDILDKILAIEPQKLDENKALAANAHTAKIALEVATYMSGFISVAIFCALVVMGGASTFGVIPLIVLVVGLCGLTPMLAVASSLCEGRSAHIIYVNHGMEAVRNNNDFTANISFATPQKLNEADEATVKDMTVTMHRDALKALFFASGSSKQETSLAQNVQVIYGT